jgi:hypothetical protein
LVMVSGSGSATARLDFDAISSPRSAKIAPY